MSRSIHKTVKGVFRNKSKAQVNKMISEDDPDVLELAQKYSYKSTERSKRQIDKFLRDHLED